MVNSSDMQVDVVGYIARIENSLFLNKVLETDNDNVGDTGRSEMGL